MSRAISSTVDKAVIPNPPPPPPTNTNFSVCKTFENSGNKVNQSFSTALNRPKEMKNNNNGKFNDTLLIAKVEGKAVGGGPGVLYSSINGHVSSEGKNNSSMTTSTKPNVADAQVRKLVYNMYRGLLSTKHDRANDIVDSAPNENVAEDEGVNERVKAMMRQQTELREGKMINLGPPPPPPPPPFSAGSPPVQPHKPVVQNNSKAPTSANVAAPPAVLASAMMKEKKPFTYTPGGINLAEINDGCPQQMMNINNTKALNNQIGQQPKKFFGEVANGFNGRQDNFEKHLQEQNNVFEPKKYSGSNIPSRSFRILQAMTDTDESVKSDDSGSMYNGACPQDDHDIFRNSSLKGRISSKSSDSGVSLSSDTSSIKSRDNIGLSNSPTHFKISRQSSPRIERKPNGTIKGNREISSKPFQSTMTMQITDSNNYSSNEKSAIIHGVAGSRFPDINKNASNNLDENNGNLVYRGDKIPSKLFKQLQDNFPNNANKEYSVLDSKPSVEALLSQLTKNIKIKEDEVNKGRPESSLNCNDSIRETASVKQSVLKELTSHYDPKTNLKKPKAAPGRVFHYLQQKYDNLDSTNTINDNSTSYSSRNNHSQHIEYGRSNTNSNNSCYEIEPKPYNGSRIPGRTFKLLQENIESHPSVLQARK